MNTANSSGPTELITTNVMFGIEFHSAPLALHDALFFDHRLLSLVTFRNVYSPPPAGNGIFFLAGLLATGLSVAGVDGGSSSALSSVN